jgi:hypothetical protein
MSVYIIARSDDSTEYYPGNNASEFTVQLNQTLDLGVRWVIGLCELSIVNSDGIVPGANDPLEIYVCSNIGDTTYVGGAQQRLLRRFVTRPMELNYLERIVMPVYYTSTVLTRCSEIEIRLVDRKGSVLREQLRGSKTTVVLHLKRRKNAL